MLYVFEDNEAVITMIIKGRSPQSDMCQEPKELLGIGCLTELSLILNSDQVRRHQTSTRRHFDQR